MTTPPECAESGFEQGETKAPPAPGRPDEEIENPAQVSLAEAERRAGDLVAFGGEPPELGVVVAAFEAPLEPFLERVRRELPMLGEGPLMCDIERLVVVPRTIGADRQTIRLRRFQRSSHEIDLHPPEVANELMSAIFGEPSAVVIDDVHLDPGQTPITGPALGQVEQVRTKAEAACFGMHARLVHQVGQIALTTGARVGDDLPVDERGPRISTESRLVEPPPLAQLVAREGDAVELDEVGPVAFRDQRGNAVRVVQRRRPHDDLVYDKPRIGTNRGTTRSLEVSVSCFRARVLTELR